MLAARSSLIHVFYIFLVFCSSCFIYFILWLLFSQSGFVVWMIWWSNKWCSKSILWHCSFSGICFFFKRTLFSLYWIVLIIFLLFSQAFSSTCLSFCLEGWILLTSIFSSLLFRLFHFDRSLATTIVANVHDFLSFGLIGSSWSALVWFVGFFIFLKMMDQKNKLV